MVWLKNADCAEATRIWAQALADVEKLNSAGTMNWLNCGDTSNGGSHQTDWRLPNVNELKSLVNLEQPSTALWLETQGFTNVRSGSHYWSGTSYAGSTVKEWYVRMGSGYMGSAYVGVDINYSGGYVWPVRSGGSLGSIQLPKTGQTTCYDTWYDSSSATDCYVASSGGQDGEIQAGVAWPSSRFTDNGNGTVADNLTGLVWLKNANCADVESPWATALVDVASLNNTGTMSKSNCGDTSKGGSHQTDWRLPNANELQSLVDFGQSDSATWLNTQGFTNVQSYSYWSGTSLDYDDAWLVYVSSGITLDAHKTSSHYVWPVRAGSLGLSAPTILIARALGLTADLTWRAVNGDGIAGFKLYYGTTSGSYIGSVDLGNVTSIGGYYSVVLTATEGTYYVAITAYDSSLSESAKSTEKSVTVLSAPTGLIAVASGATVSLAWDAVSGAAGYRLYYGTTSGPYSDYMDPGNVTSKSFAGAPPGTYYAAIIAYAGSSSESDKSAETSVTVTTNP